MSVLLLKFDAPLQSWGIDEKLKDHNTDDVPSKSAVIGMIASAENRSRDQDISDLNKIRFGTRIDYEGSIVSDFHVSAIGTDYYSNKLVAHKNTKVGTRYYLQGAEFTCGLEADEDTLNTIEYALAHPAHALYLGRRDCPVTVDLVTGIVPGTLETALKSEDGKHIAFLDTDKNLNEDNVLLKRDMPITFDPENRKYAFRKILKTVI